MARLPALPAGHFPCQWCRGGVRFTADGSWPDRCPFCGMHPHPGRVDETVGGKVDPARAARRTRRGAPRVVPLGRTPAGEPVLGIDPGARYTGVVLRDGDVVLHASTLVRPDGVDPAGWARQVVDETRLLLFTGCPANTGVGVEGITEPKGFAHGRRAPIDPAALLFAGTVFGALVAAYPQAVVVPPGGNGSQHVTHYPPELVGVRPADLPGSGGGAHTRAHEQSAYDVAGKAARVLFPRRVAALADLRPTAT